jgi:hypothetical protein
VEKRQRVVQTLSIIFGGILAVLVCAPTARVLLRDSGQGQIDFHSYWYAGHFIWQSDDPYSRSLALAEPTLPVTYWDGVTQASGSIRRQELSAIPGITAPLMLVAAMFSRFSWPVAVKAWTALNLGMLLVIAWSCSTYFSHRLRSRRGLLLLLLLLSFISTREAIETGQSTIIVLGLVLLSVALVDRNEILGGILLGVALSKFTLTFPAVLVLLYRRRFLAVFVSAVVQIAGAELLAWIGHTSFFDVIRAYVSIATTHMGLPGMHLAQGLLAGHQVLQAGFAVIGLIAIAVVVIELLRHDDGSGRQAATKFRAFALLTALMLFDLLVVYHRRYDFTAGIMLFALAVFSINLSLEQLWITSARERNALLLVLGGIALVWILPLYWVLGEQVYKYVYNAASVAAFCMALWILHRSARHSAGYSI